MASYRLFIKPSAVKELERVPLPDRRRVAARLRKLSDEPRPARCEKLSTGQLYRIRQGRYRILYEIAEAERTVTVIKIGHRREVYR